MSVSAIGLGDQGCRGNSVDSAAPGDPIRWQIRASEASTFHDQQGALARNRGGGARNAESSNVCPGSFLVGAWVYL